MKAPSFDLTSPDPRWSPDGAFMPVRPSFDK
jgi:hypothetical protein